MYIYIYSGLLSKSGGQVLRVAAVFHVLFSVDPEREASKEERNPDICFH